MQIVSSIFSDNAIKKLLSKHFIFFTDKTICNLIKSVVNDVYIISTEEENYFLKVYRFSKSRDELTSELNFILLLHQNGILVSLPVRTVNQTDIIEIQYPEGLRYAVLYSECKGSKMLNKRKVKILGKTLALIHNIADSYQINIDKEPCDFQFLLDEPIRLIKNASVFFSQNQIQFFEQTVSDLKKRLNQILVNEKPYFGVIHGDYNGTNSHFLGNNVSIFDFDYTSHGWRAYDISIFLWGISQFGVFTYFKKKIFWNAFLKGYQKERKITKREYTAIKMFLPIRDIWQIKTKLELMTSQGCEIMNKRFIDDSIRNINKWMRKIN